MSTLSWTRKTRPFMGFIENVQGLAVGDEGCQSPLDMIKGELDLCGYYSHELHTNLNVFHCAVRERSPMLPCCLVAYTRRAKCLLSAVTQRLAMHENYQIKSLGSTMGMLESPGHP